MSRRRHPHNINQDATPTIDDYNEGKRTKVQVRKLCECGNKATIQKMYCEYCLPVDAVVSEC